MKSSETHNLKRFKNDSYALNILDYSKNLEVAININGIEISRMGEERDGKVGQEGVGTRKTFY